MMNGKVQGKPTNFSVACGLLSQLLKNKGSLPDMAMAAAQGPRKPPTTMSLLPGVDVSNEDSGRSPARREGENAPLTIFYGGKVMVFDNFPADKAMDLMKLAGNGTTAAAGPAVAGHQKCRQVSSDTPQARRASLHRFLEKRKDRIMSKSPYASSPSPATAPPPSKAAEELPAWLALAARSSAAEQQSLEKKGG